jgi:hypothetical protein
LAAIATMPKCLADLTKASENPDHDKITASVAAELDYLHAFYPVDFKGACPVKTPGEISRVKTPVKP